MIEDYRVHLVEEVRAGRMSRRDLIRRASVSGLGFSAIGTLLTACGGDPECKEPGTPATGTEAVKEGAFRQGGMLRVGNIGCSAWSASPAAGRRPWPRRSPTWSRSTRARSRWRAVSARRTGCRWSSRTPTARSTPATRSAGPFAAPSTGSPASAGAPRRTHACASWSASSGSSSATSRSAHLSDSIGVMYLGQLVDVGPADDVFRAPHHPYTEALLSAVPDGTGRRAAIGSCCATPSRARRTRRAATGA